MNAELEIISIKNKYKRKLLAVEVLVIVVIVVIVVVVVSDCSAKCVCCNESAVRGILRFLLLVKLTRRIKVCFFVCFFLLAAY